MNQNPFYELFVQELRDLYSAETQIVKALPKIIETAVTPELREAFQKHLKEGKNQVTRLEKIFSLLNETSQGETCAAMEGLIEESCKVIESRYESIVKDAALIAAAQRIEHYEIASYGVAKTFAKQLDLDDIADLLEDSQNEEIKADKKLTSIAEGGFFTAGVNKRASER